MTQQEVQAKVEELIKKGHYYFKLQDKPGSVLLTNCVREVYSYKNTPNYEQARENLAKYVFDVPNYYWVNYRRSTGDKWENFTIDTRPEEQQISQPQPTEKPEAMTIDDRTEKHLMLIADLKAENARLEQENRSLKAENTRLEEEIEAMEADEQENQQATMADQTVSMVGQVAQILPAVLDKWFSLQEQKNALLAEQLRRNAHTPPPAPQAAPKQRPFYQQEFSNEEAGY